MSGFVVKELSRNSSLIKVMAETPYHKMLFSGTLCPDIFSRFLVQDYIHMQVTSACWLKLSDSVNGEDMNLFTRRSEKDLENAKRIKNKYLPDLSCLENYKDSKEDTRYLNFLNRMSCQRPAYLLSALMPCYLLYQEIFKTYQNNSLDGNTYGSWICDQYSPSEYSETLPKLVRVLDKMADDSTWEERNVMQLAFIFSLRHEGRFFDRAMHASKENNAVDDRRGHQKSFVRNLAESRVESQATERSL